VYEKNKLQEQKRIRGIRACLSVAGRRKEDTGEPVREDQTVRRCTNELTEEIGIMIIMTIHRG